MLLIAALLPRRKNPRRISYKFCTRTKKTGLPLGKPLILLASPRGFGLTPVIAATGTAFDVNRLRKIRRSRGS